MDLGVFEGMSRHWLEAHWLRFLTATGMAEGANRVSKMGKE
jgi:hypothetical protein